MTLSFFRFLWPRAFRVQISLFLILLTIVGSTFFAWFTGRQQTQLIRNNIFRSGTALVENLAIDASNKLLSLDYAGLEVLLLQYAALPDVTRVLIFDAERKLVAQVIDKAGEVEVSYDGFIGDMPLGLSDLAQHEAFYLEQNQQLSIWKPLVVGGKEIGFVDLDVSLAQIASVQRQLLVNTLSFGFVSILVGLFLLFVYLRRPIAAIQNASEFAFALDENLGRKMPVEHFSKEFKYLGESLNAVSQRLHVQARRISKSENHLQSVLANAVDGIIALDQNLRIVSFNPAAERLFEYESQAILHQPVQALFETAVDFLIEERASLQQRTQLYGLTQTKRKFVAELSKGQVDLEEGRLHVLIVRDITERLNYESALRRSEEESRKLSIVASRTSNAVVITDESGLIEWVNEGFTRLTEYRAQEVIGKKPGSFLQGPATDMNTVAQIRHAIKLEKGFKGEILNYTKSKKAYWLELDIQPVFSKSGELTNYIAVETDITGRIESSQALELAVAEAKSANKAKSAFLSRMSHELRTPLNAILGFGQILTHEDLDEVQLDSAQHIVAAGSHLLELIDEVLDISRIEAGSMALDLKSVSLEGIVHDAFAMVTGLANEKEVDFEFTFDNQGLFVKADAQRLKQVFINLFSNAIKYNQDKGKVFVSCSCLGNGLSECSIRDTGLGISEENMGRLFVPFDRLGAERTEVQGTGIGLALTKNLIEAMEGSLRVESTLNKGTSFTVRLHSAEVEQSHEEIRSDKKTKSLNALKSRLEIIYIEDNQSNIALAKRLFSSYAQLNLHVAGNGTDGLKLSEILKPDLILLDLNLPDMSGDQVLKTLKENSELSDIPIIILSADATKERPQELLRLGARAYLTKPIIIETLLESISNAVESKVRA